MAKDWSGNVRTTWAQLGASNHTEEDREENDYYATEPKAVELLMNEETFDGTIWENCCGEGHLAKPMKARGYEVISTDLIDRGYGRGGITSSTAKNVLEIILLPILRTSSALNGYFTR